MTPKELLYIEDALGHAKFLKTQWDEAAAKLTDPALKSYAQQMAEKNKNIFNEFFGLI